MSRYEVGPDNSVNGSFTLKAGDILNINENAYIKSDTVHAVTGGLSDATNSVAIVANGYIGSQRAGAIYLVGTGNTLEVGMNGHVHSGDYSSYLGEVAVVTNRGTISSSGFSAVSVSKAISLYNEGAIKDLRYGTTTIETYAVGGGSVADIIRNTGTITGVVFLSTGNDTYDGRGGQINGIVDLGDDDDRGYGGSGSETFKVTVVMILSMLVTASTHSSLRRVQR